MYVKRRSKEKSRRLEKLADFQLLFKYTNMDSVYERKSAKVELEKLPPTAKRGGIRRNGRQFNVCGGAEEYVPKRT